MKKIMAAILMSLIILISLPMMASSAEPESEFVAEGRIRSSSRLSEYNGVSAFPYQGFDFKYYIHIEDGANIRDEQVALYEGYCQHYRMQVVMLEDDELISFWGIPTIKADHYKILPDRLQLLSRQELGDSNTRFMDAVKLQSGKVLVSWHEYVIYEYVIGEEMSPVDIGFAYRRTDGTWETLPYARVENHSGIPNTQGVLCQHPADNSVWSFTSSDGNKWVHAIHLSDKKDEISVDWVDSRFTDKSDGDMTREGEFPFLVAIPDPIRNSILLAYQTCDYKFFSIQPFVKGAKICIIEVSKTGGKELFFLHDKWTERLSSFALGLFPSGEFWMAYYPIDPETLSYQDLYLMRSSNPTEEILLGQVSIQMGQLNRQPLVDSSYHLLFNLSDGIYSYWVDEKPPLPTITVFMGRATYELNGSAEQSVAVVVYATTEAEAIDNITEYIMVEFPGAANIQFSYEIITANTFKILE